MGRVSRFLRKMVGRGARKKRTSNTAGRLRGNSHSRALQQRPRYSLQPTASLSAPHTGRRVALPVQLSSAPGSNVLDDQDVSSNNSHPGGTTMQATVPQNPRARYSLPREDTADTLFRPQPLVTPPRMTSSSFARLPEYASTTSNDDESNSILRTNDISPSIYSQASETMSMLQPLEPPPQALSYAGSSPTVRATNSDCSSISEDISAAALEDVFSSSGPSVHQDAQGQFMLPSPPTRRVLRPSDTSGLFTPSRPSHRRSSIQMPSDAASRPNTPCTEFHKGGQPSSSRPSHFHHRRHRHRPFVPPALNFTIPRPQQQTTHIHAPQPIHSHRVLLFDPHPLPPSPSPPFLSAPRENSFSTRVTPLPTSSATLPRSDDVGIDLQTELLRSGLLGELGGEDEDEGKDEEQEAEEEAEEEAGVDLETELFRAGYWLEVVQWGPEGEEDYEEEEEEEEEEEGEEGPNLQTELLRAGFWFANAEDSEVEDEGENRVVGWLEGLEGLGLGEAEQMESHGRSGAMDRIGFRGDE